MNFQASVEGTKAMGCIMGDMIGRVAYCLSMPKGIVDLQEADLFDESLDSDD